MIGVDSGYELYIGGNGGIKTEVAPVPCKVKTDEEVMRIPGAFLQLYREEAGTWSAPATTWSASVLTTSRARFLKTKKGASLLPASARLAEGCQDPWATSREDPADQAVHP